VPPPRALIPRERRVFVVVRIVVVVATIIVVVIIAIAVAFAGAFAAPPEVVAVLEMSANRTLSDPDRMSLVVVARRDVADGNLDLALCDLALVVFGANAAAGRSFGISAPL
jgi:hypothetical protein